MPGALLLFWSAAARAGSFASSVVSLGTFPHVVRIALSLRRLARSKLARGLEPQGSTSFFFPRADSSSEDTSWKFFARDGDEEVAVQSWGSTTERCQCSFEPADTQFVISHSYATAPLACVGNDVSRG